MRGNRQFYRAVFILQCVLLSAQVADATAHRGASGEFGQCQIRLADQVVHFAGYTPTISAATEYCNALPDTGEAYLVFAYGENKFRDMTVELEVTKDPDGKRIYYQEPKTHASGTAIAFVDFGRHGPGNYLLHVALGDGAKTINVHLPFTVGMSANESMNPSVLAYSLAALAMASIAYLSNPHVG